MKNYFVFIIIILITYSKAYAEVKETFSELSKSLQEVSKEFNDLASTGLEETVVIDNSIKEMNKAFEFIQEKIESEDTDTALKVIDYVNKSLNDISSNIPKSYISTMEDTDMSSLGVEGLEEVNIITKALGEKKKSRRSRDAYKNARY